ncbi:hypothetical protein DEU56DRAFT_915345 [Suillus clintonianus]|uniref:uncharacterized protein n=1 Tax=Suillus clintonianus TaxID=1904413 RepID=UPI001B860ACB|nr:uncharacterized protein DEU56DRAFT_915345 [Suillus clintonianus]KAG2129030.1 hypothetical protein DEU56DRAFT_915345 [Suillus clintonianus]
MTTVPVLPLLKGDYVGGEEPNEWMRQLDLNLPSTWNDAQKVEWFKRQCAPGSLAEAWYMSLSAAQTATWSDLETAFLVRWPPAIPLQLTSAQKKERLKAVVLKEADIGMMIDDERGQEWGHVRWARQVQRLAQSFGDNTCQFLDVVLNGVPDLLRDQLSDTYTDWAAFLTGVNGVSINLLARARTRAAEEQAMREDIAQLKARLQPQQQAPQTRSYPSNPPAYRPYPRPPNNPATMPSAPAPAMSLHQQVNQGQPNFAPSMPYQAPSYQPQPSTPGQNPFALTGAVPSTNLFYRYQRFPQTPSRSGAVDRIRMVAQYSMLQHFPDSESGRTAYSQQVKEWHEKHGADTMPHTGRPYHLKPGSAPLGSRECFTCGMITVPSHQAASCPNAPMIPQETKWREIVSGLVGRAIRGQNQPATPSTAVQYISSAPMPPMNYYDPMGAYQPYTTSYAEPQYDYLGNGTGLPQ